MASPTIFDRLTRFVRDVFKTNLEVFLEALKSSPNAQGYVSGSIKEHLLKQKLEQEYGFEVKRIREKWEGRKHPNHHGDLYFRKPDNVWFVLESKGVKSNSEKWHKLYNYEGLKRFLLLHSEKINWVNPDEPAEQQIVTWIHLNLPRFENDYSANLYEYEDVKKYLKALPKRETTRSRAIHDLRDLKRDEIDHQIAERLAYVMSKVKVLETHFVSGTSGVSQRTQATPRKDEFNALSVDIFLRYSEHKFLFANPRHLESSGADPNHLQQNYVMGFVFTDEVGNPVLNITEEWYEDLNEVYATLDHEECIKEEDMQLDNRYMVFSDPTK
ncbi:MAG: hypothetical protein B6D41_20780 [Chloroflexi bacterium UTCFX4]|nr:MAG: hypothetical protein B6D41_20780 [Chloroflexi bacterium UTCFX4]